MSDFFILLFTAFVLANKPIPEPTKPLIEKKSNILLVGDSLALGMSYQFIKLARENGYNPHTSAIGGSNTLQWVSKIDKELIHHKPKLVLVSLGTNESGYWGQFILNHPDIYKDFVNKINKTGAKIVWIGLPELPMNKLPQQNKVRELINNATDVYYDSTTIQIQKAEDEIHATPEGYKYWINQVWDWMVQRNIIE